MSKPPIFFYSHTYYIYMPKLLTKILLLLLAATFFSCSQENADEKEPSTTEKTIIVFMPFSDNLYSDFLSNISAMKKAIVQNNGMNNTRLVVFIAKDKQNSSLIDIKYNKGVCSQDTLEKFSTPLYLTNEGRATILNKVKQYAPASKYAMIVGSHGKGWLPKPQNGMRKATRYFGGLSKGYQIDISEFAESIVAAGMKMQFILFDDCYLSCMEVAYDLKDATDYIIASTSEIMHYGMPYNVIYKYLMSQEPNYEAVCEGFYKFYSEDSNPYGTIGVTNCKYVDEMVNVMKEINATHTFDMNMMDKVQDLDGATFSPTIFFDFGDYVKALCANDNTALEKFNNVMQRLVPYKAATEEIWSGTKNRPTKINSFSGMAISDPSTNTEVIETKENTGWWISTH